MPTSDHPGSRGRPIKRLVARSFDPHLELVTEQWLAELAEPTKLARVRRATMVAPPARSAGRRRPPSPRSVARSAMASRIGPRRPASSATPASARPEVKRGKRQLPW
jgi:hypothetical protein